MFCEAEMCQRYVILEFVSLKREREKKILNSVDLGVFSCYHSLLYILFHSDFIFFEERHYHWNKLTEGDRAIFLLFFSFWLRCTYYVGVATLRHHNRFHGCFSITHVSHTFTSNIMRHHLTCTYTNTQNHLFFSQSLKKKSKRAYHTRSLVRDIIRYPVESVEIMNLTSCITGMGCFRDMRDACRNNISFLY